MNDDDDGGDGCVYHKSVQTFQLPEPVKIVKSCNLIMIDV